MPGDSPGTTNAPGTRLCNKLTFQVDSTQQLSSLVGKPEAGALPWWVKSGTAVADSGPDHGACAGPTCPTACGRGAGEYGPCAGCPGVQGRPASQPLHISVGRALHTWPVPTGAPDGGQVTDSCCTGGCTIPAIPEGSLDTQEGPGSQAHRVEGQRSLSPVCLSTWPPQDRPLGRPTGK